MYVGHRHRATAAVTEELIFDCKRCGHYAGVVVTGLGVGVSESPFFVREAAAASEASADASADALHDTMRAISVTRCPKCGQRSMGAVARYALRYAAGGWFSFAFLWVVALISGLLRDIPWICAMVLGVIGVGTFAISALGVRNAARRVRFVERERV